MNNTEIVFIEAFKEIQKLKNENEKLKKEIKYLKNLLNIEQNKLNNYCIIC